MKTLKVSSCRDRSHYRQSHLITEMEYPSPRRNYLELDISLNMLQKGTDTNDLTNLLMNRKFFKLGKILTLLYKTHYRMDIRNSTEEGQNQGVESPNMSENVQGVESKVSKF